VCMCYVRRKGSMSKSRSSKWWFTVHREFGNVIADEYSDASLMNQMYKDEDDASTAPLRDIWTGAMFQYQQQRIPPGTLMYSKIVYNFPVTNKSFSVSIQSKCILCFLICMC
jgi:hypothetical protein